MSIASEITRLSGVRSDIFTSITNKGVAVPAGSTFSSCPTLIDSIVTGGGGGDPTSLINPSFTASGYASGYRPFTATQNQVPLYDDYSGTYATAMVNQYMLIQIPMEVFNGTVSLYNYEMLHSWQAWSIDTQQVNIVPDSANVYINNYSTNIRTTDYSQIPGSPYTYYYDYTQSDFLTWWSNIQSQSWISTAFTGQYVYLALMQYSSPTNIEGKYSYLVQTGTDIQYPDYPTTTTGYIINAYSGREFWNNLFNIRYTPRIDVSGFKSVVYDNSPEGGIDVIISSTNITAFNISDPPLKRTLTDFASNYNLTSTAYTYNYGTTQTAYSGFEGV